MSNLDSMEVKKKKGLLLVGVQRVKKSVSSLEKKSCSFISEISSDDFKDKTTEILEQKK